MKVLVTGSRGLVGSRVVDALDQAGCDVVRYDILDGQDILDLPALRDATRDCEAVVHSAALLGLPHETPEDIMAVNLSGSANVARTASELGIDRVVFLSSVDVLGVFKGERAPDYLPLDDEHVCDPGTPYGISKLRAEAAFQEVADGDGMTVVCLRPPGVWTGETYGMIAEEREKRPSFEWDPYWEYGAFIDVRDLADACLRALTCSLEGFHALLISAADLTTSGRTARELAEFVHPQVEWRGGSRYEHDPYSSLIDCEPARRCLGWNPLHTWRDERRPRG